MKYSFDDYNDDELNDLIKELEELNKLSPVDYEPHEKQFKFHILSLLTFQGCLRKKKHS